MNEYLIEHKIKTLSQLSEPFDYKGFNFRHWDFNYRDGWLGDAWVARKLIIAESATEAINRFRKELIPIVDCIAFVSQCYTTVELESFMILRKNDNPQIIFFLRHAYESKGVPLHFNDEEKSALESLDKFKKKHVFRYLRESTNSSTFYTRLAMLVAALEGIAGQILIKGKKFTNKEYIKEEIVKDDNLFQKIFAYGEGIRPQLFHGCEVDLGPDDVNYAREIYKKIVRFFNNRFKAKIKVDVRNPQRTPFGNYRGGNVYLESKHKENNINLKNVIEIFERAFGYYDKRDREIFDKFFSIIKMPKNY
ncbi:MAG: hypothetical protein KJI71_00820 [Patescibacteria group bacterium]|nr:hypothetical protein [Patescibacteria group bacterium]